MWTIDEIEAMWAGHAAVPSTEDNSLELESHAESAAAENVYDPKLAAQFKIFDLEPGSSPISRITLSTTSPVESFVSKFPVCLPPLTPTLAHVNALTFTPLVSHAAALSRTLLSLFLSPSHDDSHPNLNFSQHLLVLRSYLLLTSHTFKSRLAAALFSDSGEYDDTMGSDPCTWARRASSNKDKERSKFELHRPWAVGLAPALTDRDTWPPGGADLSFFLRTVIVDSLDLGHASGENEKRDEETGIDNGRQGVMEEAEFRLGFKRFATCLLILVGTGGWILLGWVLLLSFNWLSEN